MAKNSVLKYLGLSLTSALLLSLAWPPLPLAPLLFFAWIPLLFLEEDLLKKSSHTARLSLLSYGFLTFFIWNAATTHWLAMVSFSAALLTWVLNALLMCLPLLAYHFTRQALPGKLRFFSFLFYWVGFEFLHYQWSLSWPWLSLGNAFSTIPVLIQWYRYTGVLGGTLWVLLLNWIGFVLLKHLFQKGDKRQKIKLGLSWIMVLILPLILGYQFNLTKSPQLSVVTIQPNLDPYQESLSNTEAVALVKSMADSALTEYTSLLLLPESILRGWLDEEQLNEDPDIRSLKTLLKNYPQLTIVIGAETKRYFTTTEEPSNARWDSTKQQWYQVYNSALLLDSSQTIQIYHKSKLIPGSERPLVPLFASLFEPLLIDPDGQTETLTAQSTPGVFTLDSSTQIAPVICYESVYGEHVSKAVKAGAQFITIMTNDGWWGDSWGHKQHFLYARLRAIENGCEVIRCANTGISAKINRTGTITQPSYWGEASVTTSYVHYRGPSTFYTKSGDYIGRIAAWMAVMVFLSALVRQKTSKGY